MITYIILNKVPIIQQQMTLKTYFYYFYRKKELSFQEITHTRVRMHACTHAHTQTHTHIKYHLLQL